MKQNSSIILGALLMVCAPFANASERTFSYPDEDAKIMYFGDEKAQTYDIAIKITNPALAGKKVTGVSVALCEGATVSSPQGWLSTDLLLDSKKLNAPDIEVVDAAVSEDNVLTATFAKPYTLPAEGVYVGYSITIAKATTFGDKNPNPVANCLNSDGAYIHSTRTNKKWTSLSSYDVASCMAVMLEGDFADYAVSMLSVGDVHTDELAESVNVNATLCNMGVSEIDDIEISYSFGDEEFKTVPYTFAEPMSAKFCGTQKLSFSLPAYSFSAPLRIGVAKVNGHDNSLAESYAEAQYVVMTFVPTMRPLMEEYTGLWCGWCPRGWVAMELMNEAYPDDFVCVSYHDSDVMKFIKEFPSEPDGYPSAVMNRSINTDPYYGNAQDGFGIKDLWLDLKEELAPADIDAGISWNNEKLICSSRVKFVESGNGDDYRIQYILVGDGFKSIYVYDEDGKVNKAESLILNQSNEYSGSVPIDDSPLWLPICGGGSKISDLVYNDVAMAISEAEDVFPETIEANKEYNFEYEIDYSQVKSLINRKNFLPADGILRCVAVLLTSDGGFLNCNKSRGVDLSGVKDILSSSAEVVSTEWYDLQGRKLSTAASGINIRIERLSDGSSRVVKSIAK